MFASVQQCWDSDGAGSPTSDASSTARNSGLLARQHLHRAPLALTRVRGRAICTPNLFPAPSVLWKDSWWKRGMALLKGTLDVLVLKTLSWGAMHGFEITRWLEARSGGRLDV